MIKIIDMKKLKNMKQWISCFSSERKVKVPTLYKKTKKFFNNNEQYKRIGSLLPLIKTSWNKGRLLKKKKLQNTWRK